jgi:hypothetical protein
MPVNTTAGAIATVRQVTAQELFAFSKSDTYAFLTEIPGGDVGTTVSLPPNPSSGDYYEVRDEDGSCGASSPIIVVPTDVEGETPPTVNGASSQTFTTADVRARYVYSAPANNWSVSVSSNAPGGGGGGGVSAVTATSPLTSSGGDTPDLSLVAGTTPGDVIIWNGTDWIVRQLTQDDILPGFSIDSFTVAGGIVEVGATIADPAVTASYSAEPASATVTNTGGAGSPLDLVAPYTGGTVAASFTETAPTTITFTLTAVSVGGVTKTATAVLEWLYRAFAGPGNAGADSATAVGTTAVLNGGAGTLPSVGLFASIIGQVFNVTLAGTNAYVVAEDTGTLVTVWKDVNTGFPFAMNAGLTFAFDNAEGVTSTYVVYQSTNPLTGSFGIQAVS